MAALPISTHDAIPVRSSDKPIEEQPVSKVNYLNRCVETITKKAEFQHKMMGHLHFTLGVTTGVIFIAAVITAIVVTAIFAPPSIPFVALGAFCLTPLIQNFISTRLSVSKQCHEKSEMVADLRKIQADLPNTQQSMAIALQKLNISVHDVSSEAVRKNLVQLRPILAHYTYWHNLAGKWTEEAVEARAAEKKHVEEHPTEAEQITERRISVLDREEGALIAKANAAFYLGLLRNPEFSRELTDLMTFGSTVDGRNLDASFTLLGQRALAAQFGDTRQELILGISNPDTSELLTRAQVKEMSEDQLRQRLFV